MEIGLSIQAAASRGRGSLVGRSHVALGLGQLKDYAGQVCFFSTGSKRNEN